MPGESLGRRSRSFGVQVGSARGVVSAESKGVQVGGSGPDSAQRSHTRQSQTQQQGTSCPNSARQSQTQKQGTNCPNSARKSQTQQPGTSCPNSARQSQTQQPGTSCPNSARQSQTQQKDMAQVQQRQQSRAFPKFQRDCDEMYSCLASSDALSSSDALGIVLVIAQAIKTTANFLMFQRCSDEVYLFMRGQVDQIQRLKNAFIRDKKIVENFGGTFIGIAEHITRCECDVYRGVREQCVIVILFKDMARAVRWTESSRAIKQKDFPAASDEMEIFAVPVAYQPDEELRSFQLTEMHGFCVHPEEFQQQYINKATKLMNAGHIYHGVVATPRVERLRNCMLQPDTFVLVNCADSEEKLRNFYDSRDYQSLKEYRHQTVAQNDSCIFTLKPLTS